MCYNPILTASLHSGIPDGTADTVIVISSVVGSTVLVLLGLTVVLVIMVVLGRRALKRRAEHTQSRGISSSLEKNGTIREKEDGKAKAYGVVVYDKSSAIGTEALYQELVGAQEYASVYAQLRGATYQELNPQSREEEHTYQSAYRGKEGQERRK